MSQRRVIVLIGIVSVFSTAIHATRLSAVTALDQEFLMVHFEDGIVTFKDDGKGEGAFESMAHVAGMDTVKRYGTPLATAAAAEVSTWTLSSAKDAAYGAGGKNPSVCYRKSKLNGMSEQEWQSSDFKYEYTMEHFIYLKLPSPLVQGTVYTLSIDAGTNSDVTNREFTFDIFTAVSEAVHVNLVGYTPQAPAKAVDLYYWMGSGGARDYKGFEGKSVYLYNVATKQQEKVGSVTFWKKSADEAQWYNLTGSSVWNADFSSFTTAGTYRLAIEGVGCSQDFLLAPDIYYEPFKVSVLGFFYMRIGQDSTGGIRPVPRRPLWLPGKDPAGTKVYLTSMQPFHSEWKSFSGGDVWDNPKAWVSYRSSGNPVNPNAWGGHSDALDWDRHLGHVSIIYDMLLPFILTKGALSDDDLRIAESGNGIPDLLDEARYEVDFWLRLRDGSAYSHGLTNPDDNDAFYQAGGTAISAWANALNCAMLADCFRLAGKTDLMGEYRDSAEAAYVYASQLSDQMLDKTFNVGDQTVRGKDLKMAAAAYLYNITGDTVYENAVVKESNATTATSEFSVLEKMCQLWGVAGYLMTPQTVHQTAAFDNMKASIIYQAKKKEADYSTKRPSRRSTDNDLGYFQTEQNVHRTMIAHAVSTSDADKEYFQKALVYEADWGLGRNPLNMIQMTTASTELAAKRSVENCYSTGGNDGTPGMHPGHTPYMNVDDWACSMVMGCPSWLTEKGYPADFDTWPKAEAYFNTRYVWAHGEFTPQQTMRGKTALYGYLYGIGSPRSGAVRPFVSRQYSRGPQMKDIRIGLSVINVPLTGSVSMRILDLSGRVLWKSAYRAPGDPQIPASISNRTGAFLVEVHNGSLPVRRFRVMNVR